MAKTTSKSTEKKDHNSGEFVDRFAFNVALKNSMSAKQVVRSSSSGKLKMLWAGVVGRSYQLRNKQTSIVSVCKSMT
jgi:hypothetical protein